MLYFLKETANNHRNVSKGFSSKWHVSFECFCFVTWNWRAKLFARHYLSQCPKKIWNANINEKPGFDSFILVLTRGGILLNDFHDAMMRLDVVYEWKLIRKFQKWLYHLHMNTIATRRKGFSNTFSQCNRSCKNDCVDRIPENVALRGTLTKWRPLFRGI